MGGHKQNRHFIGKSMMRATWLLESKTLICSLAFSTIDVHLPGSKGHENISLQRQEPKASHTELQEHRTPQIQSKLHRLILQLCCHLKDKPKKNITWHQDIHPSCSTLYNFILLHLDLV